MIEVYKYLKGTENAGHLSKEQRRKINERQTNSNGNSGTQFNNKGNLTEDQTVPAKTV